MLSPVRARMLNSKVQNGKRVPALSYSHVYLIVMSDKRKSWMNYPVTTFSESIVDSWRRTYNRIFLKPALFSDLPVVRGSATPIAK